MVPTHPSPAKTSTGGHPPVVVQIEDTPDGPKLFTGDLRPGSGVVFEIDPSVGTSVTVRFEEGEPLEGLGAAFDVTPGAPVEAVVRAGVSGSFGVIFEAGPETITGCRLVVIPDGSLDKSGFRCSRPATNLRASTLWYLYSEGPVNALDLEVRNQTDSGQQIAIVEPGVEGLEVAQHAVGVGVNPPIAVPIGSRGHAASVCLESQEQNAAEDPDIQTGGTEQVDIFIEPG